MEWKNSNCGLSHEFVPGMYMYTVGVTERFPLRFDTIPFSLRAVFCFVTVLLPFCSVSPCVLIASQLKIPACTLMYIQLHGLCVA